MRFPARSFVSIATVITVLASCGGETTPPPPPPPPPGPPATLAKQAGDAQTANVGAAVPTAPAVKVTDAAGVALSGVAVTFAAASGGGVVAGGAASTGANGVATVGGWTLGNTPGANTLTATIAGAGVTGNPATFTATASAGPAKTLTKEAGDNQNGTPSTAVAVPPAVKVVDQFNNPMAGVTVTFAVASGGGAVTGATPATNAAGIATVGSWTLGAAAGANTLTATVAGTGVTGNPATFTATAVAGAFNPTANTNLGGTQGFASVNIPAGVTVTVTSDLVLTATGAITIAGILTGDCRAVSVVADGALTVSGSVINRCTVLPAGTAPALQMVGKAGYTFAASTIVRTSGDMLITNDLTLTDTDFAAPALGPPGIRGSGSSGQDDWFAEASAYFEYTRDETVLEGELPALVYEVLPALRPAMFVPICFVGGTFTADPTAAQNGNSLNPTGTPGKDGSTWTLLCKGEMQMTNTSVTGQDGGAGGGGGVNLSATAAAATGGKGGNGGLLKIKSTLAMILAGGNTFTSGGGGLGGDAAATGTENPDPAQAASGTATAGAGGDAGLIDIRGKTGIDITGALTLVIRPGGRGGNATAIGADGVNATATKPAQIGGVATANGGNGGKTPDKQLGSSGTVAGLGNVTVSNGAGGNAGFGDAQGGKGGNGVIQNKPGANGGAIAAMPGRGGNAEVRNQLGALIGTGGNSGEALFRRGLGGNGYSDCLAPITSGGKGGDGGGATGGGRLGGTGLANGTPGTTRQIQNSNGGNGGHGLGPGARGEAGSNGIVGFGPFVTTDPVFTPGIPGKGCRFNVTLTVASDPPPAHEGFVQYTTVTILDASVTGTTITFTGIAGGKWITVSGAYNAETGVFTATGSGTAANIPNVPASFTGTINLTAGTITGTVTLTGNSGTPPGGLPGHGTTYNVAGTVTGASP